MLLLRPLPLLMLLLPLLHLLTLLLRPLLLPSNSWLRNKKPAFGPVFLCLQEAIDPGQGLS